MRPTLAAPLTLTLLMSACSSPATSPASQPAPDTAPPQPATAAASPKPALDAALAPAAPAAPQPALAQAPAIDLTHNRHRWHLRDGGLLIPFASEGLWKYTQEYRRPFDAVTTHEGTAGRRLTRNEATLSFPWDGATDRPITARLWAHGAHASQSVRLEVNGLRLAPIRLGASWQQVEVTIPAGALKAGENTLVLRANQRATIGGTSTWGLYHSLSLREDDAKAPTAPPALTPIVTATRDGAPIEALGGARRITLYMELPDDASLTFEARGPGRARILAQGDAGAPVTLHDATHDATWQTHRVDLSGAPARLIKLTLALDPEVVLARPKVQLLQAPERALAPVKHVIVLVVDALRADRLSLYGQTRVQTPRMTAAGAHAAVFMHNQAAAPSSPPSHGSIQTGMIPRVHGVTGDKGKLIPGTPLMSAQVRAAGIHTAYVGNNPFGMSRLRDAGNWTEYIEPNKQGMGIDCAAVVKQTLGFAAKHHQGDQRFFVSALPFEPHTPYRYHDTISPRYHGGDWGPPVGKSVDGHLLGAITSGSRKLTEAQWSQLRALYDGEIEHMDACFGQLIDGLDAMGVLQETAIILTADHGEGMFEHGRMGHAYGHYAELSNVPLVIFAPGRIQGGPLKLDTVTSNIDLAPTALALLGVTPAPQIQGQDMLPVVRREGPWTPRVVSMEYGKSYALRARDWKLMVDYSGREQLYHSAEDPTEQQDLLERAPLALRYMRDATGFFLAHRSAWRMASWGSFNDHGPGYLEHLKR